MPYRSTTRLVSTQQQLHTHDLLLVVPALAPQGQVCNLERVGPKGRPLRMVPLASQEKSARGKMTRSKNVYHHKMGRGGYVFVKEKMIENKETEADKEPLCGIMWLKGRVNKDREFTDDEIRSVVDKLKEADDKIKKGTLKLDDGTDVMTVVFGKENEEKDVLVKKLSNEMTETKEMLSQLMNQLAAQGVQLNLSSQLQVASDVTPMGSYEVNETQSSIIVHAKDARIQKKSNGLVT
nr:hypothetical protein [Tanacetum cinerariifolium]